MIQDKSRMVIIIILSGLVISSCKKSIDGWTINDTPSGWTPKWTTIPDKSKKEKQQLNPTLAFADAGYGGSPVPANSEDIQSRESFVKTFKNTPKCFGVTLMQKDRKSADFDLQFFDGIDGRKGNLQFVLYRTDTADRMEWGEATGMTGLAETACSSILNASLPVGTGGKIE
jgi:hypothetical protein